MQFSMSEHDADESASPVLRRLRAPRGWPAFQQLCCILRARCPIIEVRVRRWPVKSLLESTAHEGNGIALVGAPP